MSSSSTPAVTGLTISQFQGVLNPAEINKVSNTIQTVFNKFTESTDPYNLGAFQHAQRELVSLYRLSHQNPVLNSTSLKYYVLLARWASAISSRLTQVNTGMVRSVKGL